MHIAHRVYNTDRNARNVLLGPAPPAVAVAVAVTVAVTVSVLHMHWDGHTRVVAVAVHTMSVRMMNGQGTHAAVVAAGHRQCGRGHRRNVRVLRTHCVGVHGPGMDVWRRRVPRRHGISATVPRAKRPCLHGWCTPAHCARDPPV